MQMKNVKINGKWDILMPEHRAARPEWHTELGWERKRLDSMEENIGKDDIVFYLGAELGEMPALCSIWGADVVLFEPNYKSWPVIKAVWDANRIKPPLKCFAGFASDVTKKVPSAPDRAIYNGEGWMIGEDGFPMYANGEIDPAHGFNQLAQEANGHPQITLDDFVMETRIVPTVITMDCEGSEGKILRGALETIKTHKPKLWLSIHPEFMKDMYSEDSDELREWIKSLGYKETILDHQHEIHTLYEPI